MGELLQYDRECFCSNFASASDSHYHQNCSDRSHVTPYEHSFDPFDLALSIRHCDGLRLYGRGLYEAHASSASPDDYFRVTDSTMDDTYPAPCSGTSSGDAIGIYVLGGSGDGLGRALLCIGRIGVLGLLHVGRLGFWSAGRFFPMVWIVSGRLA